MDGWMVAEELAAEFAGEAYGDFTGCFATIAHCVDPATKATSVEAKPKNVTHKAKQSEALHVSSFRGTLLDQSGSRQNRENLAEMGTTEKHEEPNDLEGDLCANCSTSKNDVRQELKKPPAAVESHEAPLKRKLRSNERANCPKNTCECPGCGLPTACRAEVAPAETILMKEEVDEVDPNIQKEDKAKAGRLQHHRSRNSRWCRNRRKRAFFLTEETTAKSYHSEKQEESENSSTTPQYFENGEEQNVKFRLELSVEDYCRTLADCFRHNEKLRDIRNKGRYEYTRNLLLQRSLPTDWW
ncbi:hypothetical protein Y032_0436g1444 [Ancylostoma ceylanicum]|uniref:Uncharacterized protein n=1 Tax=Ancylostoma ceylanicum TaxID=53326 RepID=A0A016X029_9BILA|nr:hypothetical protein Y032_0436g1444 [Ancylostoma ceylanicum]